MHTTSISKPKIKQTHYLR